MADHTSSGTAVAVPTVNLLTFTKIRIEIADFLAWSRAVADWSDDDKARLGVMINSGYWQMLFPTALPGEQSAHRWYFLKPSTTIDTVASTYLYDLPSAFGSLIGDLLYDEDENETRIIKHVSPGMIDRQRSISDAEGRPSLCATRVKSIAHTGQQLSELMLDPIPDAAYTLIYQYDALVGELSTSNEYPLGGQPHAQTLLQSCRDIAAQTVNDDAGGREHELYLERLRASVEYDRRHAPDMLGTNSNGVHRTFTRHGTDFTASMDHNLGGGP